jgi:hypothetical protein
MSQIVQDKMMRKIMGIQNQFLFQNVIRETKVYSADEANFEEIILENYEFKTR